jgi:hypothetical protein
MFAHHNTMPAGAVLFCVCFIRRGCWIVLVHLGSQCSLCGFFIQGTGAVWAAAECSLYDACVSEDYVSGWKWQPP